MRLIGNSISAVLVVVCGTLIVHAQTATKATTAVPRLVKFSSTLANGGGKLPAGVIGVTFSLYEQQEGGASIWMETQNVSADANGQYTVLLGSTRNEGMPAEAFASGERWLGVQVQGEPAGPRVMLTSVPYSLKAVDAETLGGLPASAYALAGTGGHGEVRTSAAGPAKAAQPSPGATPNLSGTGTANYIPIWSDSATLGNSKMYQATSGNFGIGTTAPAARLEAITTGATGTGLLGLASSATGANFGVSGKTSSSTGTGVIGSATAASGANFGVYGSTVSPNGIGVSGHATGGTGVAGSTSSATGYGVYGANAATTGSAFGVYGTSASTTGVGTLGTATATSGSTYGVYGSTLSPSGIAVYGNATSGTGVAGSTTNPAGYGVYGSNLATTGSAFGLYGTSTSTAGVGTLGIATATSGATYGVYGSTLSPAGIAVYGIATSGTGVAGGTTSPTAYGVYGVNSSTTGSAYGVFGTTASTAGVGVLGSASATSGTTYGVYGSTISPTGIAVYGNSSATSGATIGVSGSTVSPKGTAVMATATAGGTALLATATGGGLAGQFSGNVKITGNLTVSGTVSKGGGSFRIDHPLDPEHKYLYHSFVESPDMMNIYNGVTTLSRKGDAVVKLPDWFDALNRDFRYQLTCIGGFAPVYIASEVSGNQFKIGGGRPGMKVSWQVTGIRRDAFANDHRIPVEEVKPSIE